MFKNLKLIFSPTNQDIRKRLGFTLVCLFIFIVGTTIPVPGVTSLKNVDFGDLANAITGGSLKQFSIFALGVMPYISATIITSLLQMDIIPYFTELRDSGPAGRQKINQINRYLGIFIAFVEGFAMSFALVKDATAIDYLRITVILTAGTAFLLWLGDQITQKGIGNGVSLIIMAGILSTIPKTFVDTFRVGNKELFQYTCWDRVLRHRESNLGTRIDYILLKTTSHYKIKSAEIRPDIYGSDHCPVTLEIDIGEPIITIRPNLVKKKNNLLSFITQKHNVNK